MAPPHPAPDPPAPPPLPPPPPPPAPAAGAELYRALFDTFDEGCCLFELLDGPDGRAVDWRILDVNAQFEAQTGLRDAVGRHGRDLAVATEAGWLDAYEAVARTGRPLRFEQYHAATGRWYDVRAARVGGPGSRQLCTVFRDVTERRVEQHRREFLLRLSDALRPLADPAAITAAAARLLGEALGVNRAVYARTEGDAWLAADAYEHDVSTPAAGLHPVAPFGR